MPAHEGAVVIDERVVEELRTHERWHGPNMIRTIERHHPEHRPGIPLSLFAAYAERLGYDVASSEADVLGKAVDDEEWVGSDVYYRVGDDGAHLSAYPASWHARYADGDSIASLVDVMREQLGRPSLARKDVLLVLESVAGVDPRTASAMLYDARRRGEVTVEPWQNPESLVSPARR
jgi:hypothetical protein